MPGIPVSWALSDFTVTPACRAASTIQAARAAIPDVSITTDIIVGFPGETEAEFGESIAFVEQMAFARLHIFRYSRREGTAAASMRGQIPAPVAQERSPRMHLLNATLEDTFRCRFVGHRMPVLWENSEPYGFGLQWSGLTGNYRLYTWQRSQGSELDGSTAHHAGWGLSADQKIGDGLTLALKR